MSKRSRTQETQKATEEVAAQEPVQTEHVAQEEATEKVQGVFVPEERAEEVPAHVEAPAAAPVSEPVQAPVAAQPEVKADPADLMAQIEAYKATATPSVVSAFTTLETYLKEMAPNKPVSPQTILIQQKYLWTALRSLALNGQDFNKGWKLLIRLFKENKDGALNDGYVYRGFEGIVMDAENITAFQALINIVLVSAGVNKPSEVRKLVSLDSTFKETFFPEDARARLVGYYN